MLLQNSLLSGGQILMKMGLTQAGDFSFTLSYFMRLLTNIPFILCGVLFTASSILWMYTIKVFPLSVCYPLLSLSYVIAMLGAIFIFHEQVPPIRWIGVALIMLGCVLVTK